MRFIKYSEFVLLLPVIILKIMDLSHVKDFYEVLADETRIRIVYLLLTNPEIRVKDIQDTLQISQTKAARHILYINARNFLKSRPESQNTYYSFKSEKIKSVFAYLIQPFRSLLETESKVNT